MKVQRGYTLIEVALAILVMMTGLLAMANIFRAPLTTLPELDAEFRTHMVVEQFMHTWAERLKEGNGYNTGIRNSMLQPTMAPYSETFWLYTRMDSEPRKSLTNAVYLQDLTLLVGNPGGTGGGGGGAGYYGAASTTSRSVYINFIIDNSGTMGPYILNVRNNLNSFINALVGNGVTPYISITVTGTGNSTFNPYQDCGDVAALVLNTTTDINLVQLTLGAIVPIGGTLVDPYSAMIEGTNGDAVYAQVDSNGNCNTTLPRVKEPDRPAQTIGNAQMNQIVLTDVCPEVKRGMFQPGGGNCSAARETAVANYLGNTAARGQDINTYVITNPGDYPQYDAITTATGGSLHDIGNPTFGNELNVIATSIAVQLSSVGTYVTGSAGKITISRLTSTSQKPGF